MTTQTDMVTDLNLTQIIRKLSRYLRKNPASTFILAFEVLLLAAAMELVAGKDGGAITVGIYAFVVLVVGVSLFVVSVIKGSRDSITKDKGE